MLDQIEEMICFAAIIEQTSITKAAIKLNRSKAHISRKLYDMEARYKVKLFYRTTRKMRLSDAGKKLEKQALQLYNDHKKLDQSAQHIQSDLSGNFGISTNDSFATFCLTKILPKLFAQFPDINFTFNITNKPIDLVEKNIDLTIRSGYVRDENLVAKQIGTMIEKLYISTNGAKRYGFDDISQLDDTRLIVNSYSFSNDKLQLSNGRQKTILNPKNICIVNRYKVIHDIVLNSDYIGTLLEFSVKDDLKYKRLVDIFPEWKLNEWPLYLVHPFQSPTPLKLKVISDFLIENMAL